jgi:hypothetical protein
MNRKNLLYIFLFAVFNGSCLFASQLSSKNDPDKPTQQDPIKENQILYKGKVWRNLYANIKGDQFLFSSDYLPGSLSMNGKLFTNLNLNYDIYNDEIITPAKQGTTLQLNKEMVDSFTVLFANKNYTFLNLNDDSLAGLKGYVNVLYKGKSALYIKYKKEIQLLAVDDKYDLFYRTYKVYMVKDGIVHQIIGKSDFLKAFNLDKTRMRDFVKKSKLKITKKEPESFIPVIRYYDSLSQ